MDKTVQIQILREHLISMCRRSARIFHNLCEESREPEMRRVCRLYSKERLEFVDELLHCGFPLEDAGEISEPIASKKKIDADLQAQLDACSGREEEVLRLYNEALEGELPEFLRELISRQRTKIQESLDYIQDRIHYTRPQQAAVSLMITLY